MFRDMEYPREIDPEQEEFELAQKPLSADGRAALESYRAELAAFAAQYPQNEVPGVTW